MDKRLITTFVIITLIAIASLFGCGNDDDKEKSDSEEKKQEQAAKKDDKKEDEKTFGIIGAMSEEVEILHEKMDLEKTEEIAGMEFFIGTLDGENIVLVQSGVGKVNAAACAQILASHFKVDYLINSGVAGGLHEDLTIGDIVISTDAIQHDVDITALGEQPGVISRMDTSTFKADQKLIELAQAAGESLAKNFDPYAVEMEGAAIAHVAHLNDVPFVIIRAISDDAGGEADMKYEDFVKLAARNASDMIEAMVKSAKDTL